MEASEQGGISEALELHELHVRVGSRTLLEPTSITLPAGKITVIVGGSGAGKSVVLRILAGLTPRHDDAIEWSGSITGSEGRPLRRVGIVFQQFALFDELSPLWNVQFAIDHRRDRSQPPEQSARQWLDELRVPTRTPVAALSGGQKQRLAIARTLAADPDVVLYDEPTSGLDAASGRQVAALIQRTQQTHGRTSIVVTHDYETLLPIADHVLLLDSERRQLVAEEPGDWKSIPDRMQPVATEPRAITTEPTLAQTLSARGRLAAVDFMDATGAAIITAIRLPWDAIPRMPRIRWGLRFLTHYLNLVAGPSAWIYLIMAGLIVGFAGTHFTFRYLPFSVYTKPLLIEDLLAAIGFALYRILVPVMATILIAARCGAAVAADVGVKRYGSQVDALQTLGVRPTAYLLVPILAAFVIGTPLLEWVGFQTAQWISMLTFAINHPQINASFWQVHFYAQLQNEDAWFAAGVSWVLLKNVACGIGIAAIAYYRGIRPKRSAGDVSESITATVLWTTLFVLLVHFVVAFLEF
ncbi:Aliphatic sulfonates import ATP-binding protein SsuB [Rosistilla carotiformis]|uniref:Aliphatic sulfonates import ATP-binding protein SsuB n=1 Tax=Rosistilla carotiformis TaxID=2528017 RepID=A0A518JQG0_9BACT|nr:ABC transporter permease [Rosistilla carotiformis]QDV67775.1 Aliphatic sulfonates import ATP-binding protein SsuB [Rosistilla carotiformis]